jgi:hypothetical protein
LPKKKPGTQTKPAAEDYSFAIDSAGKESGDAQLSLEQSGLGGHS